MTRKRHDTYPAIFAMIAAVALWVAAVFGVLILLGVGK